MQQEIELDSNLREREDFFFRKFLGHLEIKSAYSHGGSTTKTNERRKLEPDIEHSLRRFVRLFLPSTNPLSH